MKTPHPSAAAPGTVTLHRVLRAPAERIYRAFLDADAMCKWLPPHGFTGRVLSLDARVGGTYRMQFTHFGSGQTHAFGGEYVELVPGEMRTTIVLRTVMVGTEVSIEQAGIPAVIPAEMCYLGWQESLQLLAQLVEPEIPVS